MIITTLTVLELHWVYEQKLGLKLSSNPETTEMQVCTKQELHIGGVPGISPKIFLIENMHLSRTVSVSLPLWSKKCSELCLSMVWG